MIKLNGSLLGFILFVLATFLFLQTNINRMSKNDKNTNILLEKKNFENLYSKL